MEQHKPRCFGHYKDAKTECQKCPIYQKCYETLMERLINDPETPTIIIGERKTCQ